MAAKNESAAQPDHLERLHLRSERLATSVELEPILDETLRTAVEIEHADLGLLLLYDLEKNRSRVGASIGFSTDFLRTLEAVSPQNGVFGISFQGREPLIVEDVETDPVFVPYREAARRAGFRAVYITPLITRAGEAVGVLSTHFRQPRSSSEHDKRLIDLCVRQAVGFIENARLSAQLREAEQRKDEFLATLAHELRNPLAPLSNSLHILRMSGDLSPATVRVREIMERQVCHLVRLVDDLLEISRVTRGKIEMRKESVELAAVISNAVEASRPFIEAAGHQLAIILPPDSIRLEADPVRIAQVIANLLHNAAKYTDDGGQIWLTARREGSEAVISVRDNGLGIPPDMLPRIFDMFAQVDRTLKRAQGGLGIGLTLAKSFVQMHGGRIDASSGGPGKGSEFTIRLPIAPEEPHVSRSASMFLSNKGQMPARRILVVDDIQAAAYTLSVLLETMGQQVRTTHDAVTALECALVDHPDVIISDIAMPDVDGYEFAQRLRQQPTLKEVLLVALTGYGQACDRQRAKEAGFDRYLVKPVSVDALQSLLTSLPSPDVRWSEGTASAGSVSESAL